MKGNPPKIEFVLNILKFASFNPYKQTIYTRIFQILAVLLSSYVLLLHLSELIFNFEGVETVGKTRFTPCIIIKHFQFIFFAIANKTVRKPFDLIESFWPWDKFGTAIGKRMETISGQWYLFIRFYYWLILINIVNMIILPYLKTELVFDQYDYCDMKNNTVCYHINFIISAGQLTFVYVPAVFAFDLLFLAFCGQIYIQFELVKIALEGCQVSVDNRSAIKEIVDQHNVIIECVGSLNSWMSTLFMAKYIGFMFQMISALYMLSMNGMPPSLNDMNTYGMHFMTVVLMTYMYCHAGAVIFDQSLSLSDSAYTMNWYEKGQTSLRKDVAFIILRSQQPELFTAGYFNLNMEAFVDAMQNVFSVYGLLATIAADEILAKQISKDITH